MEQLTIKAEKKGKTLRQILKTKMRWERSVFTYRNLLLNSGVLNNPQEYIGLTIRKNELVGTA